MLARLWWKEARAFGPAWLLLWAAAGCVQWFYARTNGPFASNGSMLPIAMVWAVLYAFAAGAAAFAGEREGKTLGFLDALPVDRGTLWLGKATFASVSTLGLTLALAWLAWMGTSRPAPEYAFGRYTWEYGIWIIEGVCWGLFWSAMLRNPMAAGALAVTSVAMAAMAAVAMAGGVMVAGTYGFRFVAAMAAMAASGLVMAWRPRARPRAIPDVSRPAVVEAVAIGPDWSPMSLEWQAWREGWPSWLLMMGVGLFLPVAIGWGGVRSEGTLEIVLASLACLAGGVSVFGPENASGTRRFLLHQGVAPGSAWGRKLLVWGLGLAAFLAVYLASGTRFEPVMTRQLATIPRPSGRELATMAAVLMDAFVLGVLCGMGCRRRILAVMLAIVGLIGIAPAQVALVGMGMVPPWALFITPILLLIVTRAWAGDWLADRDGPAPWVRLALMLAVPMAMQASAYAAYRAWGVADIGPIGGTTNGSASTGPEAIGEYATAAIEAQGGPLPISPSRKDGSPATRDAQLVAGAINEPWTADRPELAEYLARNRAAIDRALRASAMDGLGSGGYDAANPRFLADPMAGPSATLPPLLALEARERQFKGDLPGAWADILAQFRMARQLTDRSPTVIRVVHAAAIHHRAVGLALDWAADPKQAADLIRRARDDLKAAPWPPTLAGTIRIEARLVERMLNLSDEELAPILDSGRARDDGSILDRVTFNVLVVAPWERERARRVARILFAAQLAAAEAEPWNRSGPAFSDDWQFEQFAGSQLARMVVPSLVNVIGQLDRELANRRALHQILALHSWRLAHGGEYPQTLADLVPTELPALPIDPYSGRAFGYVRSQGQAIRAPIWPETRLIDESPPPTRPGQLLLYSVGPDRTDDNARFSQGGGIINGDLVFPVNPPVPPITQPKGKGIVDGDLVFPLP